MKDGKTWFVVQISESPKSLVRYEAKSVDEVRRMAKEDGYRVWSIRKYIGYGNVSSIDNYRSI